MNCPQCGYECPPDFAYCPKCGTALAAPETRTHAIADSIQRYLPQGYADRLMAAGGQMAGERRVVTILFSDVLGSSAMPHFGQEPGSSRSTSGCIGQV